ncbi:ATP-binding cassette domain-containing protein [Primorskyibacter aestuariivivens]|uniref:ABC transporter ATP-binding protein n=1 Tax=Primorskyibacter aestuariivivens TaxID=1888912 RepID=UPI002300CF50|nr:oligopeptide/dipeptide ABC transporter ATP-binding protein [Primorskyibacter aestuariivivens]MDA7430910.1 ATP-binding cassette domain-containing protein [Primorskyibacter aestuariivivens]
MTHSDTPVLELNGIKKTFMISQGLMKGTKPLYALNDISVQLNKGEVLGIVGESGCGKSTLAKILLGLMEPTSGEVLIDGQSLKGHKQLDISRRVQPIFQDPYSSLNPRKRIGDIISLPLRVHGIGDPAEHERKVIEILDLVGLPKRVLNNYPNQMSGGQRQRVAIARALIMKPEIVICDEPTSALDVSVQSQILNLLMDLKDELQLTYLFISHDLSVVEHLADRVIVMYLGRICEQAPPDRIFDEPRHPYTEALLGSVLTPEPGQGVPDTNLGASYPNPINPPSGCRFHPRCAKAMDICKSNAPMLQQINRSKVECHLYE